LCVFARLLLVFLLSRKGAGGCVVLRRLVLDEV
jgi:hypothetical protein